MWDIKDLDAEMPAMTTEGQFLAGLDYRR